MNMIRMIIVLVMCAWSAAAYAIQVSLNFSGGQLNVVGEYINAVPVPVDQQEFAPLFQSAQTVTGSIAYDTNQPDTNPDPNAGTYRIGTLSVNIPELVLSALRSSSNMWISSFNNTSNPDDQFVASVYDGVDSFSSSVGLPNPTFIDVILFGNTSMLANDQLPTGPIDWTFGNLIFGFEASDGTLRQVLLTFFPATSTPINGNCGTSNGGTFTTKPTTNLCSAGTPTTISGTGPWSWSCTGINGGTDASCEASKSAGIGTIQIPRTGQISSYAAGDDGALQKGVTWPNPRFTDNNDGTVTDNLTGLVWLKNANCFGMQTWSGSLSLANNLANGSCGLTDGSTAGQWRIPNITELDSLLDAQRSGPALPIGHPFTAAQAFVYWSSTTIAGYIDYVWNIHMYYGMILGDAKNGSNGSFYVWPVRSGSPSFAASIQLPKTGQTTSYAAGDDGSLQKGASWPSPRFTDNNNGTVTDNLTGLVWLKNANCFGNLTWANAINYATSLASDTCSLRDGSSTGDWRLPNLNELQSLIDYSRNNPALPAANPFLSLQNDDYWSSSSVANMSNSAWQISMGDGNVVSFINNKTDYLLYIWPVRSGQANSSVNGACGSANGQSFTSTPNTNLCSAGTATAITGSGPWTWTCSGSNGGSNASCSATFADTLPPVGSVVINGGATASNGTSVTLTLSATDASGVSQMCISNTATCTAWTLFAATKSWTLTTGNGTKTVNVWYRDQWGNTNAVPYSASIILDTTAPTLNVTINGPGTGDVNSSPAGINCGVSCSTQFPLNRVVTLSATPSTGGSIFSGWSGDPDCADGSVTLSADKSCVATFDLCNSVSIAMTGSSGPFDSIDAAYVGASPTDTIRIIASNQQQGDLVFGGKNLTLRGGYDCAFTEPPTSFTTITGLLTISGGSVSIGGIRIQ